MADDENDVDKTGDTVPPMVNFSSDASNGHQLPAPIPAQSTAPEPGQQDSKKPVSYSQPLGREPPRRKSAMRKHSLGEEEYYRAGVMNGAFENDGSNLASNQRFYQHSSSLPEDALRHPQQPHLPPPHHQPIHLGGGGPGSFVSHERTSSSEVIQSNDAVAEPTMGGPLPEFQAAGGGTGIFKVPLRAAVHPGRPPALELRPHPLRETQAGSFLRTIACTPSQLWAGQESGVRFWNLNQVFYGRDDMGKPPRGDEESAPFYESCRSSPTLCLAIDAANRLVWSGHKDGKIRSWKMDQQQQQATTDGDTNPAVTSCSNSSGATAAVTSRFKEGLSWQAHKGPILCMVFTYYGDIWSSSEGGNIKAWPWETIEKSLCLKMEEKHMAALLVERSGVDLRNQVTVGGVCSLPSADIKFLVSDNSRSKVWSGSSQSFALWNSRTKELLKVFNIDGQETKFEIPAGHESHVEDEMKVKFVSTSKKEKSKESFFQRSRNALMGAADAVRRVASKSGAFGEDTRKTEAMTISMDGMIWTGFANGTLVQWDGNANRLQEFQHNSSSIQCLCAFGAQLWVGYMSGLIQILDLEGNLIGGWVAHSSPVIKLTVGSNYIFSLANHGGIRGWNLCSPGPIDDIIRSELMNKELLFKKMENFRIMIGSWNVGQERASHDSLISWVGNASPHADMVVVGLQEVEMGAGFLAISAAKETVGLEGSANGHWWLDTIGKTLGEGTVFERVGSRQLAALLISVWARKGLRKHIGDIDVGAVACGFGRAIGNKGSVSLRMRIYDRIVCFANCHLAAHLEAVAKRNADFDHIYRTMTFSRPPTANHSTSAGSSSAVQVLRPPNGTGPQADDGSPELAEADMFVFFGDFNYRLFGISYDEARDFVSQRSFDWLRERDQLREEMKAGKVFQGMREGIILFPPTYKFERYKPGLSGYDSGEKKRIPAWCDRILYRDNRSASMQECSLDCPVVCCILQYEACMDVTDSDHKPIRCLFHVDVARIDELIRRQEYGRILSSNEKVISLLTESHRVPEITVSSDEISLQNQEACTLSIANVCEEKAIFEISCEGQAGLKDDSDEVEIHPRGALGLPRWLEVTPACGILNPGQTMEVSVRHEENQKLDDLADGIPENWWSEDTRDKEVLLAINITGSTSTERKSHHVPVRLCLTAKPANNKEPKGSSFRKNQTNHPNNKSELQNTAGGSKDATDG